MVPVAMHFFRQKPSPVSPLSRKHDERSRMEQSPTPQQWRRWLEEHGSRLLLFARQQARSEADAADLLQEALVEVWRHTDPQSLPAVPLVYATIRRRAIDWARRDDRRRQREEAIALPAGAWFDTSIGDNETREMIESGMRQLPQIYREVVTLKIWGELTFDEIAQVLDIPANTAASRYRYGIEGLRKTLKRMPA